MAFYIDIAHPARDKALKKIRPQTEAEMDPMGFTTTPRAPRAWEPDIPTPQVPLAPGVGRPMSQAEMMDAARAYPEQPEPGSIAARLGLERRDTLPLAQEDLFSKTGQAAVEYVGKPLQKYVGEPISAFKEVLAQGTPYIGQALEGNLSELYKAPGGPAVAYEEPTADVLGLFRNQSPKEVYGKVLESHYEKPLWGQLLTEIFFPGPDWLIPLPARVPGGLGARTGGGVGRFNIPASSDVWRDAPAAVKATIKTGIQEQIGEKVAAQVRQAAPDLAPNRVNEVVDILIDDFMKPGMKPEEFQKHADLVIDRVRGYDRPPTARPTVRPDAAPMPALEPALPVAAAAPEPVVVTPRAAAAVTPEPAAEAQKIRIKVIEDEPRVKVVEDKPLSGPLPENGPPVAPISGTHRVYHGTDQVFDAFDEGAQSVNALYGPGVYTTEDAAVASRYAGYKDPEVGPAPKVRILEEGAEAREKVGNVWSMDIRVNKFLDMDAPPDKQLLDELRSDVKDYIDESDDLWPLPPNVRGVNLDNLQTNDDLYQQLVIFHGDKFNVNELLINRGYDTITHVGGARTGTKPHRVWVSLDSETVSPAFGKNKPSAAAIEARVRAAEEPSAAELSGDPSLLFDVRNTSPGPGSPMWTVFYKGTDERLPLSTLGRAGTRTKVQAEKIASDEAQKIKTRAEGMVTPAVTPEPTPVPEVTQRIAPGSTDPVEIRSSYNRELSAYGARRIPIEDVEGISYSEALEKRRDHIDGLREVFENRIAAEGGSRVVSPNDIRRIGDDLLDEIRSQPEGQERVPRLIDLRTVRDVAPAEVGSHRVYHGTIATFDAFRLGAAHDDSLYGPGVYLTDDPNIASGYAKGALRVTRQIGGPQHGQPIDSAGNVISEQEANFLAQGAPQIWSVDVEVVKFFDIDAPPDKEIMDIIKEDPDAWDRGFDGANYDIEDIKTNHELYQLMHADFGNKSEVNDWLAMLGYDTITHVGGGRTGNLPHRVYIALGDPYIGDEITSVSPQFGPRRGKEPAVRVIEALPPAPTRPALQPGQAPAAAAPAPAAALDELPGFTQDNPLVNAQQTGNPDAIQRAEGWIADNPTTKTGGFTRIELPPDDVGRLPGRMGEETRIDQPRSIARIEELADDMRQRGWIGEPIAVDVDVDDAIKIFEGNHRVRAAQLAGLDRIPVEVRYYGGSEMSPGPWSPNDLVQKSAPPQAAAPSPAAVGDFAVGRNPGKGPWVYHKTGSENLQGIVDAGFDQGDFIEGVAAVRKVDFPGDATLRTHVGNLPEGQVGEYGTGVKWHLPDFGGKAVDPNTFDIKVGANNELVGAGEKGRWIPLVDYVRSTAPEAVPPPAAEVPGPPALPGQRPMAALPPSEPPPVAPTAAAAAPPPPPPPPRGPEVFETGLDPEQPPTPFVPALVQDNLDRAALQIKLTTGEKGYLTQKWIGNWPNIPVRPTGQTLNNIPGISQFQGFFFPKYRMTLELHQSWVASGMTEWELNTQMGLSRANLFTELKTAFGEDALKGWKPPIPGDDIKGGIQQMARYYTENSNTVYLAPFIGDEAERRMFSGTLFDIATRPDMYELNEAQRAALATWKSHQDDFMDIIIAGYGVDVEKYAVPDNAVFLSNVNVGEGAIEASQTTYKTVVSGGKKRRLFDTAVERQDANPDFIPETDIEVLQTGMDMAKAHWAAHNTLKLGSGGLSKIELMELVDPKIVAAREATIRKVNSLKGRIDTAERRAGGTQNELDLLATRIKNLDERIDSLDKQIADLDLDYGPMLSHLSGELYSLKTVLSEAQGRSEILVERGIGLVDKDKDLIAQLEEATKDLRDIRERYAGKQLIVKVDVGMTSKNITYKLVEEGMLYLYFPVKDVNGIEVAKAAREIVKAENNSIVKLLNNIQQTVLGGDLSPLAAIQGHLALIANPQQIIFKLVGAGKGSIQSRDMLHIFREETMNKVIEENWEDAQDLARYIGLPFIASTPAEFAGGFLKYLKGNIGGKEYSYTKANDAMFAITLRNMLTGYQTNMKMLAAEGITGEEAKIISAMVVSDNIPLINWRLAGLSAAQYNSRRALVTSASYIVKPAELVSSMTTGLAKVATGQTVTQRERLSLRIGFNMIATVTALSVATSMYAALRNDEDPVQAGLNAANPIHPDFATIHLSWTHLPYVQDQKLPMGGPFRAIAKMVAPREVSWSPVPVPFATLLQWAMNRVGPGLQAFVRAAHPEGRDFYGYKIRKGGGVEQAVRALLYGLEGVLPLMPQTLVGGLRRGTEFGENIADSTWQFLGTGARQDSAWQERNKSAARWAESQDLNYDVGGYKDLRGRDRKLYDDTVLGALQAEAVYQKVKKDAEVGQIPWAMDLLASMDAQKNAEEAQLRDDQALEKFFDPTVTTTDPRLSLNPKDWKQQRKERALKLRATKEAIRYEPEERKWLPTYEFDEEEPTDRFFEKMASIMNDANLDRMDEKAWEDLDQWVSEQSQEDQEYIEMDAYGGSLTPKVQEYYDDLEKLEQYFEIEEKYIVTRSPEIQDLWKQYRHTNNQSRNESFLWRRLRTTLGGLARRLKDYRRKNFEVDRLLAKWDYSGTPYHPVNKREFRRIPSRPEFYFSEGEPIQASPQTGVSIADILEGAPNTRTPAPTTQPTPNGVSIADILERELVGAR